VAEELFKFQLLFNFIIKALKKLPTLAFAFYIKMILNDDHFYTIELLSPTAPVLLTNPNPTQAPDPATG
jgi:hypothetical protein